MAKSEKPATHAPKSSVGQAEALATVAKTDDKKPPSAGKTSGSQRDERS